MHILLTVNTAWNIWSLRRRQVEALTGDGRLITDTLSPETGSLRRHGARKRGELQAAPIGRQALDI